MKGMFVFAAVFTFALRCKMTNPSPFEAKSAPSMDQKRPELQNQLSGFAPQSRKLAEQVLYKPKKDSGGQPVK